MSTMKKDDYILLEKKKERPPDFGLIGESEDINKVRRLIEYVSPIDSTVIIYGEPGTGKELIANAIYENSKRKNGPFIVLNCAQLGGDILDAELFGVEKNFATGVDAREGKFKLADKGSLFLDEIAKLPENTQALLLRTIENKEIWPKGARKLLKVDVRIICATNCFLDELIKENKFRQDLHDRLNQSIIHILPIRERKKDIMPLTKYFIERHLNPKENIYKKDFYVTKAFLDYLLAYRWPGNVRELKNLIDTQMSIRTSNKKYLMCIKETGELLDVYLAIPNNIKKELKLKGIVIHDMVRDIKDETLHLNEEDILTIDKIGNYWSKYGEISYTIDDNEESPEKYYNNFVTICRSLGQAEKKFKELSNEYIKKLVEDLNGNIADAARKAGIPDKTFRSRYNKILKNQK